MYIVNMASGCTDEGVSFVSLDDLDNISILLDENNDLELQTMFRRTQYSFTSRNIFIFKLKKVKANKALNTQNMYRNYGVTSNDFKYVFQYSNSMVWFGNTIFSNNKESMMILSKFLNKSLFFVTEFEKKC